VPREADLQPTHRSPWRHWPLAAILLAASFLVFTGLQRDYLWADEGDTAVLARNILKYGVPTAWDGVTFTDSDYGSRLTDDFVMVSSPWLQYYVTAVSFTLAGESTWAARLPFALMGLLTIALVYVLLVRATANRWTAATGAALLTLSVQFLIFSRSSRHYTLHAALTCLLVLLFTRLRSWSGSLWFALVSVLLFHSHPIGLVGILALGAASLVYRPYRIHWPWFWRAAALAAPLTLPWLILARRGYSESTGVLRDLSVLLPRLAQYAIEVASVTSVIGSAVLLTVLWRRHRANRPVSRQRRSPQPKRQSLLALEERELLVAIAAIMTAYAVTMAITQPRDVLWTVGMRYTPAVLPFMAIVLAILIARTSRFQWRPWLALFLVFGFTKAGRVTPWTFWEDPTAKRPQGATVAFHNPERVVDRVLRTGQLAYLQSLTSANTGTLGRVVEYLRQHATRDDVVVTNYSWEPLYFHTGLKQGMTVLPSYPVYRAARERGLPDYVFEAEGARWIVWRRAWGAYRGHQLDRILGQFAERRIPVSLVATIPETLWENRENMHFRRFPENRYIYPWFGDVPDTLIFRVDWPAAP
jgi:4-amino-4-deoxy-L-arabinose transferase-like glycosyltransferase